LYIWWAIKWMIKLYLHLLCGILTCGVLVVGLNIQNDNAGNSRMKVQRKKWSCQQFSWKRWTTHNVFPSTRIVKQLAPYEGMFLDILSSLVVLWQLLPCQFSAVTKFSFCQHMLRQYKIWELKLPPWLSLTVTKWNFEHPYLLYQKYVVGCRVIATFCHLTIVTHKATAVNRGEFDVLLSRTQQ